MSNRSAKTSHSNNSSNSTATPLVFTLTFELLHIINFIISVIIPSIFFLKDYFMYIILTSLSLFELIKIQTVYETVYNYYDFHIMQSLHSKKYPRFEST
ncbi:hypothetical protein EB796_012385 [Bugula neritina]|uniref:Uncharacterized protein n=1 Tax=Bugula neritina TaxID=10212 RepID=A0A7J7JTJ4_BUGNE|nr:hypothetical protein EB796_012385 [Bugula neritina]